MNKPGIRQTLIKVAHNFKRRNKNKMSTSKRILSLVLCAVMMVGVMATGLYANAAPGDSTVKTYAELVSQYGESDSFVYQALRLYDDEGKELENGAVLDVQKTYTLKIFLKSNYTIYGATYLAAAFDSDLFNDPVKKSGGTQQIKQDSFVSSEGAYSEIVSSTGFTSKDVQSWKSLRVTYLVSGNESNPRTGTPTSDDPVYVGTVTLKANAVGGQAVIDDSFYVNCLSDGIYKNDSGSKAGDPVGMVASSFKKYEFPSTCNLITDGNFNFSTTNKVTVNFENENGTQAAPPAEYNYKESVELPQVSGVYGWTLNNEFVTGQLYADEDMTLVAVPADKQINVTLNAGEGATVNGQPSVTFSVPIGNGFADLSGYEVSFGQSEGVAFGGWKDDAGKIYTDKYTFTSAEDVTLTAHKAGALDIVVQTIKYNEETAQYEYGYETLFTYYGEYEQYATNDDYLKIVKRCADMQDQIPDIIGISSLPLAGDSDTRSYKVVYSANGKIPGTPECTYSETLNTSDAITGWDYTYFGWKNSATGTPASIDLFSGWDSRFGVDIDEDGGLSTLVLNACVVFTADVYIPQFDDDGIVKKDENGKYGLAWNEPAKTDLVFTPLKNKYAHTDSTLALKNATNALPLLDADISAIDTYYYDVLYRDGNETSIPVDDVSKKLAPKYANTDNDNPMHLSVYVDVVEKPYYVGIYVDKDGGQTEKRASYTVLGIGDTVTLDSFEYLGTENNVINGNETGKFPLSQLYKNGAADDQGPILANRGYRLTRIYLVTETGEQIDVTQDGDNIKIDKEFINKYIKDSSKPVAYFNTEWAPNEYTVKFNYLGKDGKWIYSHQKTVSGNEAITYASLVDEELKQTIADNCPESLAPYANALSLSSEITADGNGTESNIYAYMAEGNEDNVLNVYASYNTSKRTAFVDFNNGLDKDGNVNEDKVGQDIRYSARTMNYSTVIHDPEYDVEESGLDNEPFFTSWMRTTAPNSTPAATVAEVDGEEKITDPKADEVRRPYRNCEFIGFKVYYVEGVYSSFEDLPAQDTWKEGYNDRNETGAQHIYTTSILQMQWMADTDFLFRVYDDSNCLSWALGKNFKSYYWAPLSGTGVNAIPATKADIVHCQDPENNINLLFLPKRDEVDGSFYFYHLSIEKTWLNLITYAKLIPTIIDLLKSGTISQLLG